MPVKNKYVKHTHISESNLLVGQTEVDESYFGARRVRGKRGRGARGKTIVFGLLKRSDKVYTEIVPNCKSVTLQRIIKGKTSVDSVIHSDRWRGLMAWQILAIKSILGCTMERMNLPEETPILTVQNNFWVTLKLDW